MNAIKMLDKEIEQAYYRLAQGKQINIMDIPKVFADCRKAMISGAVLDQAMRAAILMYCEDTKAVA